MRMFRRIRLVSWLVILAVASPQLVRAEIPAGKDIPTGRDYSDKEEKFLKRTILETYRAHRDASRSGKKQDDPLDSFFEQYVDHSAHGFSAQNNNALEYKGKQIAEDGCVDPMFCYCYGRLLRAQNKEAESVKFLQLAHDHLPDSPYDVSCRCWTDGHLALALRATNRADEAAKIEAQVNDLMISTITNGPYHVDEQNLLYRHIEWTVENDSIEAVQKIFDEIDGNSSVDPWLQNMVGGKLEVRLAWQARGGGWASSVTEAGWTGFKEHMDKACAHLNEAWTLQPQYPEAATEMIVIAMAGNAPPGESTRLWFDRAVAAQFDYAQAYTNVEYALLPRWGGTHELMYRFGRECLQTHRFDTYVPYQLLAAFESIYGDIGGDFDIFKSPGVYEDLIELSDGYINQEKDWNRQWYRSYKVAVAARFGKWDDARRFMDALEAEPDTDAFNRLGIRRSLTLGEIHTRTGEMAKESIEAERLVEAGQLEAAKDKYAALVAQSGKDGYRHTFLAKKLADVNFQLGFDSGEWTPLPIDTALTSWFSYRGKWTVDEKGRIVGVARNNGLRLIAGNKLGNRFEIRGKAVFVSSPDPTTSNLGIYFGRETGNIRNSVMVYQQEQTIAVVSDSDTIEKVSTTVNESNPFVVQRWDDTVSATLNGQPLLNNVSISSAGNPSGEVVALGSTHSCANSTIRFEDLEVRKLTEDPAAQDHPDQAKSAEGEKPADEQNAEDTQKIE